MKSFLEYIAEDIIAKHGTDFSDVTIVFPNKRASLFMSEILAMKAGRPIWSPAYITISDLFRSQTKTVVADPVKLVCELYKVYSEYHGSAELTLDKFYGWGQLMIADFDDIDKNMADADAVFSNITAFHELEGKIEFTPGQREAIERFFNVMLDDDNSKIKGKFLKVWNSLAAIYHRFNERLAGEGLAYEGALYRKVVEGGQLNLGSGKYIFVGFNVVQEVESRLFSMLKDEGRALFYWDYDNFFMPEANSVANEAGRHISQLKEKFANELTPDRTDIFDAMRGEKNVKFVSAPTENIQARYVHQWLKEDKRMEQGRSTAIVMCDETLLQTIIHCLPEDIPAVNVTTGYPLSQAPVTALVASFLALHSEGYVADGKVFRLRFINAVLSHPYSKYISPGARELRSTLNSNHRYFPGVKELVLDDGLSLIFSPMEEHEVSHNAQTVRRMAEIVKLVARNFPTDGEYKNGFAAESLFRTYTLLMRIVCLIEDGDLIVTFDTLRRLIMQIIGSTTIPFHGEPAEGVQVMGVLETRNLDFEHVLILSCNEGNMPKGINDASFIPHAIRYGHGLTTIDNKVSVYAYYFNSMIQRCKDVTIVYNNSTEGGKTGEMSRFMLQMMVEKPEAWKLSKTSLSAGQNALVSRPDGIAKDGKVAEAIDGIDSFSPTAINNYLYCQLRFFYNYVAKLKENDETDDDSIDNRIFGLVFHEASETIYNKVKDGVITRDIIDGLLKDEPGISRAIDEAFKKELFKVGGKSDFKPKYNGMQLINKEVIRQYIEGLLRLDRELTPFTIMGLESDVCEDITINTANGERKIKVGGRIDRIDKVKYEEKDNGNWKETIRVVDYKTGAKGITVPLSGVDDVFDATAKRDSHRDYYLQAMLYSLLVSRKHTYGNTPVSPALLFIQHSRADDTNPTIYFKDKRTKEYISDIAEFDGAFMENLKRVMGEILDTSTMFMPTEDRTRCTFCPYCKLCW